MPKKGPKPVKKTPVIFRKDKSCGRDDIVALFPTLTGSHYRYCVMYQHTGQHHEGDPVHAVNTTELAKPEEYADLKEELESIGYNLEVKKRISYDMTKARIAEWESYHK